MRHGNRRQSPPDYLFRPAVMPHATPVSLAPYPQPRKRKPKMKTCKSCEFAVIRKNGTEAECRRNAPNPKIVDTKTDTEYDVYAVWPVVLCSDRCGEHKPMRDAK